ncbi:MAG: thiamine-phosphate kinase [bacterium]
MSTRKLVSDIGEIRLIDRIKKQITRAYKGAKGTLRPVVGIGDDAAVVRPEAGKLLVASTDMLVEGIHFNIGTFTPYEIGLKAMAVNLSDIAAMGAAPRYGLVTLGLPVNIPVETVDNLIKGTLDLSRKFNVFVIGGDIVSSPNALVVSITVWGSVEKKKIIRRSGAKAGDLIMVTGTMGDSAAGLSILGENSTRRPSSWERKLVSRHLRPYPRVRESGVLAKSGFVSSMIDSSDGLMKSIYHLCRQSNVGAKVYTERIPLSASLERFLEKKKEKPSYMALCGGEEYELVFTVSQKSEKAVKKMLSQKKCVGVSTIGEIVGKKKGVNFFEKGKRLRPFPLAGFEHFRSL